MVFILTFCQWLSFSFELFVDDFNSIIYYLKVVWKGKFRFSSQLKLLLDQEYVGKETKYKCKRTNVVKNCIFFHLLSFPNKQKKLISRFKFIFRLLFSILFDGPCEQSTWLTHRQNVLWQCGMKSELAAVVRPAV